jgi:hypothetical protein
MALFFLKNLSVFEKLGRLRDGKNRRGNCKGTFSISSVRATMRCVMGRTVEETARK